MGELCARCGKVGFRVPEQHFCENVLAIALRFPVLDHLLVFQYREIAPEHHAVLQTAGDRLLQAGRELPWSPAVQLIRYVWFVSENCQHLVLPWIGGTGGEHLEPGMTCRHQVDVARMA